MPDATDNDTVSERGASTPDATASRLSRRKVQVEFGSMSHVGKVRAKNEDHYLIFQVRRSLGVVATSLPKGELPEGIQEIAHGMVVADGMGGMAAGERASMLAIRTGVKLVLESPRWALKMDEHEARQLIDRLKGYFRKVDETLINQTKSDPRLTGMGTTLTVAYSVGGAAFIVHAGDSRVYQIHDGKIRQLTRDHTLAQNLADLGAIPPKDVHSHSARHVLTNFAGGPSHGIEPEISITSLFEGDRLLLCTDGLTRMVPDEEILAIVEKHPVPQDAVQALVDRALERGGRDNVTVLLASYTFPEDDLTR